MGHSSCGYQHILGRYSVQGYARRSRRAAALLITVLITVAAATITLLLVKQALDIARNESNKSATRAAQLQVENLKSDFDLALEANPFFFYDQVYDKEPSRECTLADGSKKLIGPGSSWPVGCGNRWSYSSDPHTGDGYVEITPPNSQDSLLKVKFAARVGTGASGTEVSYVLGQPDGALVADTESLDLGRLASANRPQTLSGTLYSGGSLTYTPGSITFSHARLLGEQSAPTGIAGVVSSASPTTSPSIRDYMDSSITISAMKAAQDQVAHLACGPLKGDSICLKPGNKLTTHSDLNDGDPSNDSPLTVPTVSQWLILPSAEGTLDLYFMSKDWHSSLPSSCNNDCMSFAAAEAAAITPDGSGKTTHPGLLSSWTLFGSFDYPSSGLIYAPVETHIGLCGNNFSSYGTCSSSGSSDGSNQFYSNLTFVVGSTSEPADLFLSGSVKPSPGEALGALVSGKVALPYWAHTSNSAANYQISLHAIGDPSSESIFYAYPNALGNASSNPSKYDADMMLTGSLAGSKLGFPNSQPQYFNAGFKQDPALLTSPAPYVNSGSFSWADLNSSRLDPSELVEMLQ